MQSGEEQRRQVGVSKLFLALLTTILVGELILRSAEGELSGNLAHVEKLPQIIAAAGQSDRPAVLLLGNSLTNNGMNFGELQSAVPDIHFGKVTPDATGLWDWKCILRRHVLQEEVPALRVVVVGFAWHLLSDRAAADPSRQGALFCRLGDLLNPGEVGLSGPSDVGEFAAARALRLYALRDTMRNQLLGRMIPHYRRFVADGNAARAGNASTSGVPLSYTYTALSRLVNELQGKGIQTVLVAMPVPTRYEIDPALSELAATGALKLLDYRGLEGISNASFIDSMHLGEGGSETLSRQLARDISAMDISR